jgi:integrase
MLSDSSTLAARGPVCTSPSREACRAREAAESDFAGVARDWLENIKGEWAPQHYADSLKRFEVHIFLKIRHRPIREITAPELLAALRAIEAVEAFRQLNDLNGSGL